MEVLSDESLVAALVVLAGCFICFLGRKLDRSFGFLSGFVAGGAGVHWIFNTKTVSTHHSIPLLIGLLGACVCGVLGLLLYFVTLGAAMGYVLAVILVVIDNGYWLGHVGVRGTLYMVFLALGVVASVRYPVHVRLLATSVGGAFLTVLGLDQLSTRSFTSGALRGTFVEHLVGVSRISPHCDRACYVNVLIWAVLAALGLIAQYLQTQLRRTEEQIAKQKLLAEDRHISYQSVDTFARRLGDRPGDRRGAEYKGAFTHVGGQHTGTYQQQLGKTYNYFDPSELSVPLQSIYTDVREACGKLQVKFGFQSSSVENQSEHLMFLLGNQATRRPGDHVSRLHKRLFSNYREWCDYLSVTPMIAGSVSSSDRAVGDRKLQEMALWLCIWGEAASLRHMPECLCFIFHKMATELAATRHRVTPPRVSGSFLSDVIKPIYELVRTEKGDLFMDFRNYDDWNEFFWAPNCLKYGYSTPSYAAPAASAVDLEAGPQKKDIPVAEGLKKWPKTYVERRSWLHPLRSFWRVFAFLMTALHVLIAFAFLEKLQYDIFSSFWNQAMLSCVLTVAGLSLLKDFLELWATYPLLKHSLVLAMGFIVRFVVKGIAFLYLTLFYIWSFERPVMYWRAFVLTAFIYMTPQLLIGLSAFFPAMSTWARSSNNRLFVLLYRIWWPSNRLYVGRNVHEPETVTWKYQVYWLIALVWKFFCSYHFQVRPLVKPTLDLLEGHYRHTEAFRDVNLLMMLILWLPFVLVYLFDLVIWYAVMQAVTGAVVGLMNKLGQIRTFDALIDSFTRFASEFDKKLVNPRAADRSSNNLAPGSAFSSPSYSGGPPVLFFGSPEAQQKAYEQHQQRQHVSFYTDRWRRFALTWNEIIDDIRRQDFISNEEQHFMRFRFPDDWSKEYYLPLFLTAGVVDAAIETTQTCAADYAAADEAGRRDVLARFKTSLHDEPLSFESLSEVWELTTWLLDRLLGDRHHRMLATVFNRIKVSYKAGAFLSAIDARALPKLKSDLLDLVRALRIAASRLTIEANKRMEREMERSRRQKAESKRRGRAARGGHAESSGTGLPKVGSMARVRQALAQGRTFQMTQMLRTPSHASLELLTKLRTQAEHFSPKVEGKTVTGAAAAAAASAAPPLRNAFAPVVPAVAASQQQQGGAASSLPQQQQSFTEVSLHVSLLRDQIRKLFATLTTIFRDLGHEEVIKAFLVDKDGFLWKDSYAQDQVETFCLSDTAQCSYVLWTLYDYFTLAKLDAQPNSSDGVRRLLFWANSLFMDLPKAPSVKNMFSWTVLTPFYSEDVFYSDADLATETEDGVSVLLYLETIYPKQWVNFLQRIQVDPRTVDIDTIRRANKVQELRLWATHRGQTLRRTVDGMMLYEKALRLQAKLEETDESPDALRDLVKQKFQYVVSCQVYGRQKKERDPKADDIDELLYTHPNLRIAYIDSQKVNKVDPATGRSVGVVEEFFSVLIKGIVHPDGSREIREVYRVKLPGNPILGEGKPENQNHAIIFTRGEMLQTIDMNQENYLEDSVKMRNLLQEFQSDDGQGKPISIVGFREHIFTGSLSSVANYMAQQEATFVTLGQRVLHNPLRIRFHYGHPDVFDKLYFMSRGGVSKATKGLNLSEDIFAGYNTTLRGGHVAFREYLQCGKGRDVGLQQLFKFEAKLAQGAAMQTLTRDVYRLAFGLDFFRLLSFFYAGLGFYISNSLTIWALHLFLYCRFFMAALGLEDPHGFSGASTISYWFGTIGFLLTLPIFSTIGLEKGFRQAFVEVGRMIFSGGPLFFMFHMGTKAFYFGRTLLAGGAAYRPTGRGFVTRHEKFAEIFRFHASSHLYSAVELGLVLVLYGECKTDGASYGSVTWAGWLLVAAWFFSPFLFNPMGFEWEKTVQDAYEFRKWIEREEEDGNRSWKAWWKEEISYLSMLSWSAKLSECVLALRHCVVGLLLIAYLHATNAQIISGTLTALAVLVGLHITKAHFSVDMQFVVRAVKALAFLVFVVGLTAYFIAFNIGWRDIWNFCLITVACLYCLHTLAAIALILGYRGTPVRHWNQLGDALVGGLALTIVGALSMLSIPSRIQTRLLFHNAFSKGVVIDKLLRRRHTAEPREVRVAPSTEVMIKSSSSEDGSPADADDEESSESYDSDDGQGLGHGHRRERNARKGRRSHARKSSNGVDAATPRGAAFPPAAAPAPYYQAGSVLADIAASGGLEDITEESPQVPERRPASAPYPPSLPAGKSVSFRMATSDEDASLDESAVASAAASSLHRPGARVVPLGRSRSQPQPPQQRHLGLPPTHALDRLRSLDDNATFAAPSASSTGTSLPHRAVAQLRISDRPSGVSAGEIGSRSPTLDYPRLGLVFPGSPSQAQADLASRSAAAAASVPPGSLPRSSPPVSRSVSRSPIVPGSAELSEAEGGTDTRPIPATVPVDSVRYSPSPAGSPIPQPRSAVASPVIGGGGGAAAGGGMAGSGGGAGAQVVPPIVPKKNGSSSSDDVL